MTPARTIHQRRFALAGLDAYGDLPERIAGLYRQRAAAIRRAAAAGATPTEIAGRLGVARKIVYDALAAGESRKGE